MVPFASTGDFGYSERDLGPDRVEVTYRGAAVPVSPIDSRNDPKTQAELDKSHDLALWRAAQIAAARNKAGLKIENETHNSDVTVHNRTYYRPSPFYDPFYDPFWPHHRPFPPFYDDDPPIPETIQTATARAEEKLTVTFYDAFDAKAEGMLSTSDTLARMQAIRGSSFY